MGEYSHTRWLSVIIPYSKRQTHASMLLILVSTDVSRRAMEQAGLKVLVDSPEGGVLIATSPDGFRTIYLQGHPEYGHHQPA